MPEGQLAKIFNLRLKMGKLGIKKIHISIPTCPTDVEAYGDTGPHYQSHRLTEISIGWPPPPIYTKIGYLLLKITIFKQINTHHPLSSHVFFSLSLFHPSCRQYRKELRNNSTG
ncbi:unnamed protein product [Prunus armeniaca]